MLEGEVCSYIFLRGNNGRDDCGSTAAVTNHARSTQRSHKKYNLVSQNSLSHYDI
jgi:hypothetical protein